MRPRIFWKVLISVIFFVVISQSIRTVGSFIGMRYYLMNDYLTVWSKIMMPEPGPPPMEFRLLSIGFAVISGIIYTLLFSLIMLTIPGKSWFKKGIIYGLMLTIISELPTIISMFLLINLPVMLLLFWFVEGLLINLFFGVFLAKVFK